VSYITELRWQCYGYIKLLPGILKTSFILWLGILWIEEIQV